MKANVSIAATIVLVLQLFAACGRSQTSNNNPLSLPTDRPYMKVFIRKSGEVTLDGKQVTLDEVKTAFASLAQRKGLVLYARESPEEYEPHPNAMQVINLVTERGLPIRLCLKSDCSDAFDANGKLKT